MPYTITTMPAGSAADESRMSRVAVATLDEAREEVRGIIEERDSGTADAEWADALTDIETRGTIGPLPDGTVIEVRRVSGYALAQRIAPQGTDPRLPNGEKIAQWVAAFNAGSRR